MKVFGRVAVALLTGCVLYTVLLRLGRVLPFCVLASCAAVVTPVHHQDVATTPRDTSWVYRPEQSVYLDIDVRHQLNAAWDSITTIQKERAYCLGAQWVGLPSGDSVWYVIRATRVVPTSATPTSVSYDCNGLPSLHVHIPTTCPYTAMGGWEYKKCRIGGEWANIGWPSDQDYLMIDETGAPFDLIQFGPNSFIAFFPRRR